MLDSGLCVWIHQNRITGILVPEQESQTSAVACKKCRSFSVIPVAKFSLYQCLTEQKKMSLYYPKNKFSMLIFDVLRETGVF